MRRLSALCLIATVMFTLLTGCTSYVKGKAVAVSVGGDGSWTADKLLLKSGSETSLGVMREAVFVVNYEGADPRQCEAAFREVGSPLLPKNSIDHADINIEAEDVSLSSFESIDIVSEPFSVDEFLSEVQSQVSACPGGSPLDRNGQELGVVAMGKTERVDNDILIWSTTSASWNCSYGVVLVNDIMLFTSLCGPVADVKMSDWMRERREDLTLSDL
ncbi:MAG: hypothetical protein ACRCSF_01260 [Mycobacteriaceae bacterium]